MACILYGEKFPFAYVLLHTYVQISVTSLMTSLNAT